ncbi:unnamed protein product, partial [Musa acuminata subsp. burmannicoides]
SLYALTISQSPRSSRQTSRDKTRGSSNGCLVSVAIDSCARGPTGRG